MKKNILSIIFILCLCCLVACSNNTNNNTANRTYQKGTRYNPYKAGEIIEIKDLDLGDAYGGFYQGHTFDVEFKIDEIIDIEEAAKIVDIEKSGLVPKAKGTIIFKTTYPGVIEYFDFITVSAVNTEMLEQYIELKNEKKIKEGLGGASKHLYAEVEYPFYAVTSKEEDTKYIVVYAHDKYTTHQYYISLEE